MDKATHKPVNLQDTAFQNLMQRRIFNVLLIASDYDAFMLEEDGRVEEQLFFEYVALNLSSPPRVTRVSDIDEALECLADKHYDIVFTMPGVDISEAFDGAKIIKQHHPDTPIIVLTPFSREVSRRIEAEDMSGIDFVFSWLGNVDLLLAIIKLLEDRMNADNDIGQVGVQMILLVEDSVRFYSSVLPTIYKFLLQQSVNFASEALNEHEQMLRMRGRPKVMLARCYEEAMELYDKFHDNILGVISDVSFKRNGVKDRHAGLRLGRAIRALDPYMPIIVESSDADNADRVTDFDGVFVDKNSKKLSVDLGNAITRNFGFGDFIVIDPDTGNEVMRLRSLKDLQNRLKDIPDRSLYYHAAKNDISRWLYSRAMFSIARPLRDMRINSEADLPQIREVIRHAIIEYRRMKNRGVVAVYRRDRFDHYSNFARIGDGSLGGKGRGLAFVDSVIKKSRMADDFHGVSISIPRTVVLCTDIFDEFMADNDLYHIALSSAADEVILHHFLNARLPSRLTDDFLSLFEVVDRPLAIRSSSLLEDSHYQPFAGIYSTYMIPRCDDRYEMLNRLCDAIKGVYASVFYSASKAYMNATRNVIDQKKMAIIIQEVVGDYHLDGKVYFPSFSGVGRSLNYYPIGNETTEDGVAQVAIGLGKYIVDGGTALRFSPRHPRSVLQSSTLDLALRDTQRHMNVLQRSSDPSTFSTDDNLNIISMSVQDFAGKPEIDYMVSTYNAANDMLVDNNCGPGRRVVTFANILRDNVFPLAQAVEFMLTTGQNAMGRPVEIEFAGQINRDITPSSANKGHIYWLQIRPIVDKKDMVDDTMLNVPDDRLLLKSTTALGHGVLESIQSVVYVKPGTFDSAMTPRIAAEIAEINNRMAARNEFYILIGPGRWGTSDNALGIPVKWPDIANARLIAEAALQNYRIEPSQGTHFFQNLTSFGVGYLTVNPFADDNIYNIDFLDAQPAVEETEYVRVVRFDTPLRIGIDGRHSIGIVLKPDTADNPTQ